MEDHPRGRGRDTKLRHRRPLSRNQCSGTDDHHTTIREIGVKHAFVRCATAKWNPACTAIVEAANGPTTADADALLAEKKIEVFPDVCCNSGGVVVSCYEWLHNRSYEYWTEEDIQVRLKNASHVPNVNKINFIQGIQQTCRYQKLNYLGSIGPILAAYQGHPRRGNDLRGDRRNETCAVVIERHHYLEPSRSGRRQAKT